MFNGMGDTPELAKKNLIEQIKFFKENIIVDNYKYPTF